MTESLKMLIKLYKLEDFNFKKINEVYIANKDGICCFINEHITINSLSLIRIGFYKQNNNSNYDLTSYNGNSIIIYYGNEINDRFVIDKDGKDNYVKRFSYYDCKVNSISCYNINEFNNLSFHEASNFSLSYKKQFRVMNNDKPNFYKFKDSILHKIIYHDKHGKYDRDNGPALTELYHDFKLQNLIWYKKDRYFNKYGGPTFIHFYTNGRPAKKHFSNSNLETINFDKNGKLTYIEFKNGTTGNFPTVVTYECDNNKDKYISIRWNRNKYLSSEINGLTEVELVDNELNLYFYNNDELVTDEFVLAIMEHNLSGVEKQIIKNLKKMIEED